YVSRRSRHTEHRGEVRCTSLTSPICTKPLSPTKLARFTSCIRARTSRDAAVRLDIRSGLATQRNIQQSRSRRYAMRKIAFSRRPRQSVLREQPNTPRRGEMGWAVGYDSNWNRDIGYGVPTTCDHPGCNEKIDRGLSYVCGDEPYGGEHGCGL